MSHKTYRICLLMVAVAATVGGILYYCFFVKDEKMEEKGTLVKQMQQTGERMKEAGKNVKDDVAQALSRTGEEIRETAAGIKKEVKETAGDVKNTFAGNTSDPVWPDHEGDA